MPRSTRSQMACSLVIGQPHFFPNPPLALNNVLFCYSASIIVSSRSTSARKAAFVRRKWHQSLSFFPSVVSKRAHVPKVQLNFVLYTVPSHFAHYQSYCIPYLSHGTRTIANGSCGNFNFIVAIPRLPVLQYDTVL